MVNKMRIMFTCSAVWWLEWQLAFALIVWRSRRQHTFTSSAHTLPANFWTWDHFIGHSEHSLVMQHKYINIYIKYIYIYSLALEGTFMQTFFTFPSSEISGTVTLEISLSFGLTLSIVKARVWVALALGGQQFRTRTCERKLEASPIIDNPTFKCLNFSYPIWTSLLFVVVILTNPFKDRKEDVCKERCADMSFQTFQSKKDVELVCLILPSIISSNLILLGFLGRSCLWCPWRPRCSWGPWFLPWCFLCFFGFSWFNS